MDHVTATIEALAVTGADRLWILKQASKTMSVPDIGAFCARVDASEQELAALIRDRAAQRGTRPKGDLIT